MTFFPELRRLAVSYLRAPAYPVTIVFVLALAAGASTAVFSMLNAVLFRPLAFKDSDRLVAVYEEEPKEGRLTLAVAPDNYDLIRDEGEAFEGTAAYVIPAAAQGSMILLGNGQYKSVRCAVVSASFFPLLGVAPILGRGFLSGEEKRGGPRVVVLGSRLWWRLFRGDPAALGRTVNLNRNIYTVVGVMPQEFGFPDRAELWLPGPEERVSSAVNLICPISAALNVIARLKSGVTPERAEAMLTTLAPRLDKYWGYRNQGIELRVVPLRDALEENSKPALSLLFGAVLLVLLIGCVNVAHLALVKAAARRKEYAIRYALGASRWQVIRPLLCESLLLALIGGLAGLVLASSMTGVFRGLVPPNLVPPFYLDDRVLGFDLLLSALTGFALGLIPALATWRADPNRTLKFAEGTASGATGRRGADSLFVMSEVALAYVVLLGAALTIKSLYRIVSQPLGFSPVNLVTAKLTPHGEMRTGTESQSAFYRDLLDKTASIPGLSGAAITNALPTTGDSYQSLLSQVEGRPAPLPGREPMVDVASISPDYFRVMSIAVLQGRAFARSDSEAANRVAIVDQAFVQRFWRGADAIGKHLNVDGAPRRVVGVVAHIRQSGYFEGSGPLVYIPYTQSPPQVHMTLVVRRGKPEEGLEADIRKAVRAAGKHVDVTDIQDLQQAVSGTVAQPRLRALLLGGFGTLALSLAAVGTYGVMSYSISRRTREIGVRMAMGAQPGEVFRMVIAWGARLTLTGVASGFVAALALIPFTRSFLYGLSPADPMIFASVALLLLCTSVMGAYFPAARAAAVNPVETLRGE